VTQYGFRVTIRFAPSMPMVSDVRRNVTEIHYRYPSLDGQRIAIESSIHGTGGTYAMSDIAEFEAILETEVADHH